MTTQELIAAIRQAFAGVALGDGIGLRQAQAIDDYEVESVQQQAREQDEKLDWSRIPREVLAGCESSLSFFDAAGMAFHLPAFIVADIEGSSACGPVFHLTQVDQRDRFAALDRHQRRAVVDYLEWCLEQPHYDFEKPQILLALRDHWRAD
jgi:hypothetical protein